MNFIKNMFSENSQASAMRVMSFVSLLTGCYIGIKGMYSDKPLTDVAILATVYISAAFAGKAVQKSIETKKGDQ